MNEVHKETLESELYAPQLGERLLHNSTNRPVCLPRFLARLSTTFGQQWLRCWRSIDGRSVFLTAACRSRRVPVMASGLYNPLVLLDVFRDVNDELHRELSWIKGERVAMDHQADVLQRREQVGRFVPVGWSGAQNRMAPHRTPTQVVAVRAGDSGCMATTAMPHATDRQRTTVGMWRPRCNVSPTCSARRAAGYPARAPPRTPDEGRRAEHEERRDWRNPN